jgi:hypothetical protein
MKVLRLLALVLVAFFVATLPVMAQEPKELPQGTFVVSGKSIGAGLGAALTIIGAGYGFGRIGSSALEGRETLAAIVTVDVEGREPEALVRSLRERGINTSSVDRTSAVLDFDEKGVEGALRLSPHYYNTDQELDAAVEAVEELAG